jgi:hypothetical protein
MVFQTRPKNRRTEPSWSLSPNRVSTHGRLVTGEGTSTRPELLRTRPNCLFEPNRTEPQEASAQAVHSLFCSESPTSGTKQMKYGLRLRLVVRSGSRFWGFVGVGCMSLLHCTTTSERQKQLAAARSPSANQWLPPLQNAKRAKRSSASTSSIELLLDRSGLALCTSALPQKLVLYVLRTAACERRTCEQVIGDGEGSCWAHARIVCVCVCVCVCVWCVCGVYPTVVASDRALCSLTANHRHAQQSMHLTLRPSEPQHVTHPQPRAQCFALVNKF